MNTYYIIRIRVHYAVHDKPVYTPPPFTFIYLTLDKLELLVTVIQCLRNLFPSFSLYLFSILHLKYFHIINTPFVFLTSPILPLCNILQVQY